MFNKDHPQTTSPQFSKSPPPFLVNPSQALKNALKSQFCYHFLLLKKKICRLWMVPLVILQLNYYFIESLDVNYFSGKKGVGIFGMGNFFLKQDPATTIENVGEFF